MSVSVPQHSCSGKNCVLLLALAVDFVSVSFKRWIELDLGFYLSRFDELMLFSLLKALSRHGLFLKFDSCCECEYHLFVNAPSSLLFTASGVVSFEFLEAHIEDNILPPDEFFVPCLVMFYVSLCLDCPIDLRRSHSSFQSRLQFFWLQDGIDFSSQLIASLSYVFGVLFNF